MSSIRAIARGLGSLVVCACASAPPPVAPVAAPVAVPGAHCAPAPVAPDLDDAAALAKSHAYFAALDRMDTAAAEAVLAPSFVTSAAYKFGSRADLVAELNQRVTAHEPPRDRTWSEERIQRSSATVTFVASTVEHVRTARADVTRTGYVLLVWAREAQAWQLVFQLWEPTGMVAK